MSGAGQLEQTQRQVQEVVGVMRNNIDEVKIENGLNLNSLK